MSDTNLPNRFAKIVIRELADIKAAALATGMFLVADVAKRAGSSQEDPASRAFEQMRKKMAEEIYNQLSNELKLGD
jgi:hypothetical protein